jgi:polar amino acid transport system substrate-binding protein
MNANGKVSSFLTSITLIFAGLLICQASQAAEKESTLQRIIRNGAIDVGYIEYEPTVKKDPNTGKLSGHFVDTIEFIAKQADLKVKYHEETWATFVAGLQSGRYDLSIAATFATIPRAKGVAFTRPLIWVGNSIIVKRGETRFKDVMELDRPGVTVAVTSGEAGSEFAKNNFTKCSVKVLPGPDQSLTFSEVSSGRADAALGDAYATKKFAAEHQEIQDLLATHPYNLTPASWAVRHEDQDLLNFINTGIQFCDTTGKLEEFEKRTNAHWQHPRQDWVTY